MQLPKNRDLKQTIEFLIKSEMENINPGQSYIQGSNVSAEWVLLNTVYEKHQQTDLNGNVFNEVHFV